MAKHLALSSKFNQHLEDREKQSPGSVTTIGARHRGETDEQNTEKAVSVSPSQKDVQ